MRTHVTQLRAVLMLTLFVSALIATSQVAFASREGRRTTASALTGATVYHALKGHDSEALLFGAASLYAWGNVNDRDHHRHRHHYRHGDRYFYDDFYFYDRHYRPYYRYRPFDRPGSYYRYYDKYDRFDRFDKFDRDRHHRSWRHHDRDWDRGDRDRGHGRHHHRGHRGWHR